MPKSTISTTVKQKEAIESADAAQGVKETMVTGHGRGRKTVDLDKRKAVSPGQDFRGRDAWKSGDAASWPARPWARR